MPFADIVRLSGENLVEEGKVLSYRRQKTGALIEMEVSESMQLLIDRYRRADSKYLFPVLEEGATHEQYKHCLAQENQYLAEVQVLLGLSARLTTYVFRHSWASAAYHLGYTDCCHQPGIGTFFRKMTRIYLSAFDAGKVGEANKKVSEGIKELMAA